MLSFENGEVLAAVESTHNILGSSTIYRRQQQNQFRMNKSAYCSCAGIQLVKIQQCFVVLYIVGCWHVFRL